MSSISPKVTKAVPGFTLRFRPLIATRTTTVLPKITIGFGGTARPKVPTKTVVGVSQKVAITTTAAPIVGSNYGAFRDFGWFPAGLPDPAKIVVNGKLAGVTANNGTSMQRIWMTTTPPKAYPVSGGSLLWPRAAFASVGVRFKDMAANGYQYIDGAQIEVAPKSAAGPTTYSPARALNVTVRADRINYTPNSAFATYNGWTTARGTPLPGSRWGTTALQVTATGTAVYTTRIDVGTVAAPTLGNSLWTQAYDIETVGKTQLVMQQVYEYDASGTLLTPVTSSPAVVVKPGVKTRLRYVFSLQPNTAYARPVIGYISSPSVGDSWWLGNVFMAPGDVDDTYFDGSFGTDYLFEGAAQLTRSYYYRDRQARSYLLNRVLAENCPLGVIPAVPRYAVLPTK